MKKFAVVSAFVLALAVSSAVKADELARATNNASFVKAADVLKAAKAREDFGSIYMISLDRTSGVYEVIYTNTAGELVTVTMNALLTKETM